MNIDIGKIAKTITRKNRGLEDPQLIFAARDWAIGIVSVLVLICLAVGWTVWQYRSYTNLELDEATVSTMVPYRTAQVAQAIALYQARKDIHQAIIMTPGLEVAATTTSSEGVSSGETPSTELSGGEESVSTTPESASVPLQGEEASTLQPIAEPPAGTNQGSAAEPDKEVLVVPPTLAL